MLLSVVLLSKLRPQWIEGHVPHVHIAILVIEQSDILIPFVRAESGL